MVECLDVWHHLRRLLVAGFFFLFPPLFHLREFPANVAFLRMAALLLLFPLAMQARVTLLYPWRLHQAVKVPRLDGLILILLLRLLRLLDLLAMVSLSTPLLAL